MLKTRRWQLLVAVPRWFHLQTLKSSLLLVPPQGFNRGDCSSVSLILGLGVIAFLAAIYAVVRFEKRPTFIIAILAGKDNSDYQHRPD